MSPSREVVRGWGMAHHSRSWVYRPRDETELDAALSDAAGRGLTVCHRGAGLSYGDAAINERGAVVMMEGLHRVLDFDPEAGTIRAQCGLSLEHLWKQTISHGWWLPVVPGTMKVSLGGALAMNIHGKNQFKRGSIGEHVRRLTVRRADGTRSTLVAGQDDTELAATIGAQGLNGTILDAEIALDRVHAGMVDVEVRTTGSLVETLSAFEEGLDGVDYAVGWLDCLAGARRAGRGVLHFARHLPQDHPRAWENMSAEEQALPSRILGVVPKARVWRVLHLLLNDPGMRWLNRGKMIGGRLKNGRRYLQSLAAFHFLLDYVPDWKRAYAPHGLMQYQLFVPMYNAGDVFREVLRLQHDLGVFSYLAVLKRHRKDAFAASYSVDGYSLALDFPLHPRSLEALRRLCGAYDQLLSDAGGHVYAAKDSVSVGRLPAERDPLFSSNLVRRWEGSHMGHRLTDAVADIGRLAPER